MPRLFLSYRREDSEDATGRIYDRLATRFGKDSVFMDVDTIPFGVDYRSYLSGWIIGCDVILVVIGNQWLSVVHQTGPRAGQRRLDDPGDVVRIEVAAALARDIPVIPLLVNGAEVPAPEQLPADLRGLVFRNGVEVRSGRDFHVHIDRLIAGIETALTLGPRSRPPSPRADKPRVAPVNVEPPAVAWPTNLGFEEGDPEGMPYGWFDGIGNVDGASKYPVKVVARDDRVGRCVRMQRTRADSRAFGIVMQQCFAHAFAGKTVRLAADLCSARLKLWAGLWLRVDGSRGQLFFENRLIRGSQPWTRLRIETRVPDEAEWLNYGVLLAGTGSLWADDFALTVDPVGDESAVHVEFPDVT